MNTNIEETKRQYEYIDKLKSIVKDKSKKIGRELTYNVTTFGCQMNARDSEKLRGILNTIGYIESEDENADFVIYNTCTVRENANNKVYGRLGVLYSYKKKNPNMIIALCGCMMQEDVVIQKIKESYNFVDLIFGTHNIFKFPELLYNVIDSNDQIIDIWEDTTQIVEKLPTSRKYSFKSGINIMFGCNNFCSYCIVPYVRGRERSRKPEEIIEEIKTLSEDGVKEIMLLGQNVNSYGKGLDEDINFAKLLSEINDIDSIKRIRFMTSHPKDLSDELIDVMASSDKICDHLHLPLQSGSTEILSKMNRHYTKEDYLSLVDRIRAKITDIALTTDIIVGFPGETEEDFEETLDVVRKVGFDSAFTFIYSKRTGTPAASMENQISDDVIKDRFDRLLELVQKMGRERYDRRVGKTYDVLVENVNEKDASLLSGRMSNNAIVHFPGDEKLIGEIVNVSIKECKGFYYIGEMYE
ncbi:MAG: tRNA (N6-isopentenyl adenosine(37)-C2)-methylthiotransferase MiaB [Lachnospiraceae bacterium]|nr:tRNA (N6-isopentenyl adenosine(37)-C2)-methylthiotransferase MiaB [Lachnospiraceae bacterium]